MSAVILPSRFLAPDTVELARWLLGKDLVRRLSTGEVMRHAINETEAYHSEQDLACHASKGRTKRTETLYQSGGIWYVYLCYGIHEMLNLVVGPQDFPSAILIRGAGGLVGPGRLTKALRINRELNGLPAEPTTGLWIEDAGRTILPERVIVTPRIGVDYAGPVWAAKLWRFVVTTEDAPSRPTRRRR